ncbi:hypothetical protein [Nocardioides sp. 616]|uniref:hypothetical protein n=1 Tax=Nocardioides sp. 616 TaxID=2268090 RepID=UPI000CE2BFE2|nr:hypothetical protein [Nocardioides sp. 616]
MPRVWPRVWTALVDDAAVFPPGDLPLAEALAAHREHRASPYGDLLGTFVLRDTDLPGVRGFEHPVSVVVTGGAGQIAGPLGLAARLGLSLGGVELALRDLDDLPQNARRVVAAVDAARAEGLLDEDTPVHVEVPGDLTAGWLRAADELAALELRLKFRTGGTETHQVPSEDQLAARIDAALDRETPFKATAGLHHAVRHTGADGAEHHGFLNVLLATRHAFDGAGHEDVVATLADRDPDSVVAAAAEADLTGARRWFTSFGSCSVREPLADLQRLGLL